MENIKLYYPASFEHFSDKEKNKLVDKILKIDRSLDLGIGSYLTDSLEEANRLARAILKRNKKGKALIACYEIREEIFENSKLKKRIFDKPSEKWLDFIIENRKNHKKPKRGFDITIGFLGDDFFYKLLNFYEFGLENKDKLLQYLENNTFNKIFCFHREKALDYLKFLDIYPVYNKKEDTKISEEDFYILLPYKIGTLVARIAMAKDRETLSETFYEFYNSELSELLSKEETKLWRESWISLLEKYGIFLDDIA